MADASNAETIRVAKLIDQLCDEFEQGWVRRSPARIEDLVPVQPEPLRCVLFRELLAIELEYRAKDGRPVAHGEAHERFNRLGPWVGPVVEELFAPTRPDAEGHLPRPVSAGLLCQPDVFPTSIGKFRIIRELGRGGMGIVYLADDPDGHRQVAVKVMRPEYAADRSLREGFLREARLAMTIEHDHVVAVYQVE